MAAVQVGSYVSRKANYSPVKAMLYPEPAEFERIRESGRERLLTLSQPKEPKTDWYTSVGPHLRWGTQEMIWPIKKETLEAGPSDRITLLSLPKVNFLKGDQVTRPQFYYSCGRASVIWNVGDKAKLARSTERLDMLAEPKRINKAFKEDRSQFAYSCGRESPLWQVSKPAMSCGDRPHTNMLAKHKEPHKEFAGEKSIQTMIPSPALQAQATDRVHQLSTPKPRNEGPFRRPKWEVSDNAKNATASARCVELARPKGVVDGYQLPREVEWPVSRAAKRAASTGRMEELARPIVRATMDHVQFNPDAFYVKPLALKGAFPSRIHELATPINR